MEQTIAHSLEVWKRCAETRFVRAMGEDTLDREMFLDYIVQDSIYLRDYLKVFAYAITKSDTLRDMQLYYQLLGYVNDGENVTRLNYLKDLGITDAQAVRGNCKTESMCNPIGQALLLNEQKTEFNLMLGLCVGHDTLFIKYSQAPMTALAVKDRVTGHNPLAAIYLAQGYYNKKFYPDDPEELNPHDTEYNR